MKKLLLPLLLFAVSCSSSSTQSKKDALLQELDSAEKRELQLSVICMDKNDSLAKNRELIHDIPFVTRSEIAKSDLEVQQTVIKDLKERILLEK